MLPALLMLLDWAAGEAASPYVPVVHYHAIEGPSKKRLTLSGPSAQRLTIEGPSKRAYSITGAR